MLFAFGSNGSSQLGVGHDEDLSEPEPSSLEDSASNGSIKQVVAGGNHTLILFDDGSIQATGNNEDGRCGIASPLSLSSFTTVEPTFDSNGRSLKVEQLAATWSTTTILCDDGNLYVCGTGNSGELGLGNNIHTSASWAMIPAFPPPGMTIVDVASSMAHIVVVLSNGEIYGWGKGRKGQNGEPAEDVWAPRSITGIGFFAIRAVCGRDFTLIAGEPSTGSFLVLGAGKSDGFGIKANAPASLPQWTDLAASWCSIFVLTAVGKMMAWGRNDHGQLPARELSEVAAIAAGSEHCLALTRTGKVLAWGWGEHGNCGLLTDEMGDVKPRWNEIAVRGRVTKVFAGCATSFVLTEEHDSGEGG